MILVRTVHENHSHSRETTKNTTKTPNTPKTPKKNTSIIYVDIFIHFFEEKDTVQFTKTKLENETEIAFTVVKHYFYCGTSSRTLRLQQVLIHFFQQKSKSTGEIRVPWSKTASTEKKERNQTANGKQRRNPAKLSNPIVKPTW